MLHEPAAQCGHDPSSGYKMRLGVWMFIFYSLFYAGFIAINLMSPLAMEQTVAFNLNLAVVYGFGLIIVALIQALVYDRACHNKEVELAAAEKGEAK